jgi:hypothetical protein
MMMMMIMMMMLMMMMMMMMNDDDGDGQDYYIGKKDDVKSGSGAIDHVAFNADDIEGMKRNLDTKKIEYTHRKIPDFPLEQLFIDDPDGVKVELNYAVVE